MLVRAGRSDSCGRIDGVASLGVRARADVLRVALSGNCSSEAATVGLMHQLSNLIIPSRDVIVRPHEPEAVVQLANVRID